MVRRRLNLNSERRKSIKLMLGRKQRWKCCLCGRQMLLKDATLEHIVPVTDGGSDKLDNLALSHVECNRDRGSEDFDTYRTRIQGRQR